MLHSKDYKIKVAGADMRIVTVRALSGRSIRTVVTGVTEKESKNLTSASEKEHLTDESRSKKGIIKVLTAPVPSDTLCEVLSLGKRHGQHESLARTSIVNSSLVTMIGSP